MTGYARPDAGVVRLDGGSVRRPDPVRLARRGLTRTFQQARIFPQLTLVENLVASLQQPWRAIVRRAVPPSDRTRSLKLLDEFDLLRLADERAADLSYGQKKLLEFATVLMGEPRLVLLDEPTAGVNPLLVETIERRVREMVDAGVLDETRALVARGIDPRLPSMSAHGYVHWAAHLRGEADLETAIALTARDVRAYSRRQMTWFRRDAAIRWFDPTVTDPVEEIVEAAA